MHDRREFLKLFGIGAAVVPIIGGVPVAAAESRLIEVPKLEPVDNLSMLGDVSAMNFMSGPMGITVIMEDPVNGRRVTLKGKTFVLSTSHEILPIKSWQGDKLRGLAQRFRNTVWRMEGEMITNEKDEIGTITTEILR